MSKISRIAVALLTAASVTLAPISAANASSFGSSSAAPGGGGNNNGGNNNGGNNNGVDNDEKVAEDLRAALVAYAKNSGNFENATATRKAEQWANDALKGELTFERVIDGEDFFAHEGYRWDEDGYFAAIVFRVPKNLGPWLAEFLAQRTYETEVVAPFGAAVEYDDSYYYAAVTFKVA